MFSDYEDHWFLVDETAEAINYSFSKKTNQKILTDYKDWTLPTLKKNFNYALERLKNHVGENVYVALSGGIDSQFVCLCLKKANIPFRAITMVMDNDFNKPDVNSARKFCKKHNILHEEINVNIIKFLTTKLIDYSNTYECPSPQFCSHFFFYEQILDKNPSCLLLGGFYPFINNDDKWDYNLTKAQISWRTFKHKNKCNMIGDFASYSFDFSILCMMTIIKRSIPDNLNKEENAKFQYQMKVDHFQNLDKGIVPQYFKLTGFERLKSHFNQIHSSQGVFNKLFRRPLEKNFTNKPGHFFIPKEVNECLFYAFKNINTI